MKTVTIALDELFNKASDLSQKLFFSHAEVGPTNKNPLIQPEWPLYIDTQKQINQQIDEKIKIKAIVVTKSSTFIKDKGFVSSYYLETITNSENYEQRINQATELDRTIIKIELLTN